MQVRALAWRCTSLHRPDLRRYRPEENFSHFFAGRCIWGRIARSVSVSTSNAVRPLHFCGADIVQRLTTRGAAMAAPRRSWGSRPAADATSAPEEWRTRRARIVTARRARQRNRGRRVIARTL